MENVEIVAIVAYVCLGCLVIGFYYLLGYSVVEDMRIKDKGPAFLIATFWLLLGLLYLVMLPFKYLLKLFRK